MYTEQLAEIIELLKALRLIGLWIFVVLFAHFTITLFKK